MKYNDSGQSDIIGLIVGAVAAIFIVFVGFFLVLPEIAKVTGSSIPIIFLGVILILAIIASVVLALLRGR